MAPREFYRVEDARSRARYVDGEGIFAEDTDTPVRFANRGTTLRDQINEHLHWGNRNPTPFISTYCDEHAARNEAERRVGRGMEDVRIYFIDMDASYERAEYRNLRLLATNLDLQIMNNARHNSLHEWVFLHHIPDSAVVGWQEY